MNEKNSTEYCMKQTCKKCKRKCAEYIEEERIEQIKRERKEGQKWQSVE